MQLESETQAVNRAQRQLRLEPYFPDIFNRWLWYIVFEVQPIRVRID